jgi:hypothetical protein
VNTTATNRKLRELLSAIKQKTLIPSPDFQRRLVWTNKHKIAFIKTILDDYPFPEIYIAAGSVNPDSGEAYEFLVDGQQRITTLYLYWIGSDELVLEKEIPAFKDLTEEQKRNFLQYNVVMRDLGTASRVEILEVFTRINSTSYSLNAMEIHNARYDGALKQFAQKWAEDDFFERHRVFTATDIRRMNNLRFVLWVTISAISTYFNRDEQIEDYLKRYNDEFPMEDHLDGEWSELFAFIEACGFDEKCRCWKRADLFTLLVELHRAIFKKKLKLHPKTIGTLLVSFYDRIDHVDIDNPSSQASELYDYYKAALQASNDRSSRNTRGRILESYILASI